MLLLLLLLDLQLLLDLPLIQDLLLLDLLLLDLLLLDHASLWAPASDLPGSLSADRLCRHGADGPRVAPGAVQVWRGRRSPWQRLRPHRITRGDFQVAPRAETLPGGPVDSGSGGVQTG